VDFFNLTLGKTTTKWANTYSIFEFNYFNNSKKQKTAKGHTLIHFEQYIFFLFFFQINSRKTKIQKYARYAKLSFLLIAKE